MGSSHLEDDELLEYEISGRISDSSLLTDDDSEEAEPEEEGEVANSPTASPETPQTPLSATNGRPRGGS